MSLSFQTVFSALWEAQKSPSLAIKSTGWSIRYNRQHTEHDSADIELIVAALVHDLGDDLAPENHSQMAAAIIRPYVREEVTWIIEHHGVFQMFYYGDAAGLNKNERERYRDHEWFDSCEQFCRDWDQMAFDPDYPTKPLSYFEPMLRTVFFDSL